MSLLLLLRHAKAGWAQPGMQDFDRPLDETGRAQAMATGVFMRSRGLRPEIILCSPAQRTRETLTGLGEAADIRNVRFVDALYGGDAGAYLDSIKSAEGAETMLLIGHNPMMENIATALSGDGSERAKATLHQGFPTSGLAMVRLPLPFADAEPGQGYLEDFVVPQGF